MKKLARALGLLALVPALVIRFDYTSLTMLLLAFPKVIGASLMPFVALAGGLGALIGLLKRDRLALGSGLFGAGLLARYIRDVSAEHDGFARAFGPDWEARIPPECRVRMLADRYVGRLPDAPPGVRLEQDVVFGTFPANGAPLLCDLWQPPQDVAPTGLGIIYLHGSGWHYLDKDFGTRPFFGHLAGQGHVIMDVAYTLAPQADLYGMIGDVQRAVAWFKVNAAQYGVDPERIVVMGGSAGGQLALLQAHAPEDHPDLRTEDVTIDTSVCAVVSFYGPPDLIAFYNRMQEVTDWWGAYGAGLRDRVMSGFTALGNFTLGNLVASDKNSLLEIDTAMMRDTRLMITNAIGGTPDDVPDRYALFSPLTHVGPHGPPTLLLQGEHDIAIRPEVVRRFHAALQAAGVRAVYVEYPRTDHGFDLFFPRWSPATQAAIYDVERFLALL